MVAMAKTKKKIAPNVGRQAPTSAWTPDTLLSALQSGTNEDRIAALKKAGIIDSHGKLTKTYENWGEKVTRTPEAEA